MGKNKGLKKNIHIQNTPDEWDLRESRVFDIILKKFNKENETSYTKEEVLCSLSLFQQVQDFFIKISLSGEIQAEKTELDKILNHLQNTRKEIGFVLREVDILFDEIYKKIHKPCGLSKNEEKVKQERNAIKGAYYTMKERFQGIVRETKDKKGENERYFNHLKEVMEIVISELPNPTIEKALIALLHDSIEDIQNFDYYTIKSLYGEYIAKGVNLLTKKDWKEYLYEIEKKKLQKMDTKSLEYIKIEKTAKERRNEDYFGHLDEIQEDDFLDVKLADRIHNLRTLDGCDKNKIERKIQETEIYFLKPDIKKRNKTAYNIILSEINRLKNKYNI